MLAFVAAVALAIGLIFPYRGVILSVIGVAFVVVIVVASAMHTAQAGLHAANAAMLGGQVRERRSRTEDADARLGAVTAGRAVDGPIAEQLHRVHHHLRFCSWSLTERTEKTPSSTSQVRPRDTPNPRYNATIVWPIQIDLRQIGVQSQPDDPPIIFGFLAVDSLATRIFSENHAWIGAGIADACFTALTGR